MLAVAVVKEVRGWRTSETEGEFRESTFDRAARTTKHQNTSEECTTTARLFQALTNEHYTQTPIRIVEDLRDNVRFVSTYRQNLQLRLHAVSLYQSSLRVRLLVLTRRPLTMHVSL